jgi:RHS repeat-associated protein
VGAVDCTCPQTPNFPYTGIVIDGYQYRRYQTSAQPFWTPLGFPGEYLDSESDFFENWNRYYDSAIGRYLQTEPKPDAIVKSLATVPFQASVVAASLNPYSYAGGNSLYYTDPERPT